MITPDLIIKSNGDLIEACKSGALNGLLVEVPSFSEGGEPVLVNFSHKTYSSNTKASVLIDLVEQQFLDKFKRALIDISMNFYLSFKEGNNNSRRFSFIMETNNNSLDSWLSGYADKSPVKNRKSLRGYIFSIDDKEEAHRVITQIVDELFTFEAWADALSLDILNALDIDLFPALLLSRKNAIREMECRYVAEQLITCLNNLNSIKKKISDNSLLNEIGLAMNLLIFSDEHLLKTSRRKDSTYRNIYLRLLSFGTEQKFWIPAFPNNRQGTPRFQFRAIGSELIEQAIDQAFSKDRKANLTSAWSKFIICTSMGKSLNFPIQIRLLFEFVHSNSSKKGGFRRLMAQLNAITSLNYPLDMCEQIHTQIKFKHSLNWYEEYSLIKRNEEVSVVFTSSISSFELATMQPLPEEWLKVLRIFHESKISSDANKKKVMHFVKWAIQNKGASSPWDIHPLDLYNPSMTKDSYFDYVNSVVTRKSKKTKRTMWGLAKAFYRQTSNHLKLEGYDVKSPFSKLPNVDFTGRGRRRKTPRARISSFVIDKMIEILCSFDENGLPTYKWAEELSLKALNSKYNQNRTDHFHDSHSNEYVYCPSRASSLASLLALPLRGVQVRWLDEGRFDEKTFDVSTRTFKENGSQLKEFKSEYGRTQLDINGRNVGVIQPPSNALFSISSNLSIYVNTNKTQLWNPDDKNGYEIPWPYIENPTSKYEKELNLPYYILFEQLKWVDKHSPDAMPLRFDHLPSDKDRVTNARDALANVPFILPLFRDLTETVSYKIKGKQILSNPPISKYKIETLFNELCVETEKQLRADGIDVVLADENGESVFDIHTLRVTGISHLLDIGVPIHIVSEFIAGHSSIFMTLGYSKSESEAIKEKILNASKNHAPSAIDKVLVGQNANPLLAPNAHNSDINLNNRNIATFAPVEGGVCPLGGKGCAGCLEGMQHPDIEDKFIPVQGGCGNCRFWLTNKDFILEQMLEFNRIMFVIKESGREIKYLNECIEEAEWELEDSQTPDERKKINVKITTIMSNIKGIEESLAPLISAWTNRYLAIEVSMQQVSKSGEKLSLIGDININANLKSGSEFQLIHSIVEQAYLLPKGTVPVPENPARALREFLDTIICYLDTSLLFARITDRHLANKGAIKLANYLNNHFTQDEIESLSNGDISKISTLKLQNMTEAANLLQKMVNEQLALPTGKRSIELKDDI